MRVTGLDMYTAVGQEAINFALSGHDTRGEYEVRNILGLDAEDIVPKFYGAGASGGKFYEFTLKPRNIVLRVVLKPNVALGESYSDVRDRLYRVISANRTGLVTLNFKSGGSIVAGIVGSIVKFEASHFTKLPEVQITIRCDDPKFKAVNPVIFGPDELASANPVTIPDSISTAPHGFQMEVTFTAASDSFTIQDVENDPEWAFKVVPNGGFEIDDVLCFSSVYGEKYLYLVRGETVVQLADRIDPAYSTWPILFPGANSFHFVDLAKIDWNFVQYYASYWGV